jgi:hypothetical protein
MFPLVTLSRSVGERFGKRLASVSWLHDVGIRGDDAFEFRCHVINPLTVGRRTLLAANVMTPAYAQAPTYALKDAEHHISNHATEGGAETSLTVERLRLVELEVAISHAVHDATDPWDAR